MNSGKPAHFIFVTEDGTISAWATGKSAELEVDNSDNGSSHGAVYKGATSGEINGKKYLYVTNFRSGEWKSTTPLSNAYIWAKMLSETTAIAIATTVNRTEVASVSPRASRRSIFKTSAAALFVTYAKQDGRKHDDVAGAGLGFVEIYSPRGRHIGHLEHGDWFNSPWGVVWTTRDFGEFSNSILVGNFGSGWIAAFNGFTYKFEGFLKNSDDSLLTINGLWSLTFGNDGTAGPANTLFFSRRNQRRIRRPLRHDYADRWPGRRRRIK